MESIARKLRQLASGYWDLSSLTRPLSQKMLQEAKESERIPLWRAVYGSNGRILWQVNVAFDEDKGKASQIITGKCDSFLYCGIRTKIHGHIYSLEG